MCGTAESTPRHAIIEYEPAQQQAETKEEWKVHCVRMRICVSALFCLRVYVRL
jgi:hypothetical protein